MKVVVIGGGVAGLAVALRLGSCGFEVTLCDNGPALGGKMNRWSAEGFCFDTGPTLLTMPEVLRRLFTDLGQRLEDYLNIESLDPHAEYVYPDGFRLTVAASWEQWTTAVRLLEPDDVAGVERLHEIGRKVFMLSQETFFRRHPLIPPQLPPLRALRHLPWRHAWGNYAKVVERLLRNSRLQRIYLRYPTYVGSSPYLCPATLLVIPYLEHATGVWFVRRGMYRMVEALSGLAAARGVELITGAQATEIEHRQGRVRAVHLANGVRLASDVVVYTGDAAVLPSLLGYSAKAPQGARSLSGFVILLGLRDRIEGLRRHTVFFSADYREEFDDLFLRRRFPRDPTVYVHAPDDPGLAPPGGQALFLMANAPGEPACLWDRQAAQIALEAVLGRLERSGLRGLKQRTAIMDLWHPGRLATRFLAPGGAIYGQNSHGWRRAFLRPPNRLARPRGLYCAGGSFHPGGGVPMALLSAEITARLVKQDWGGWM